MKKVSIVQDIVMAETAYYSPLSCSLFLVVIDFNLAKWLPEKEHIYHPPCSQLGQVTKFCQKM